MTSQHYVSIVDGIKNFDLGKVSERVSSALNAPFTEDDIEVACCVIINCNGEKHSTDEFIQVTLDPEMHHYQDTLSGIFSDTGVKVRTYPLKLSRKFSDATEKLENWLAHVMPDQYADAMVRGSYNIGDNDAPASIKILLDRKPTPEERRNIPTFMNVDDIGRVPVKLNILGVN